jgi:acyl carrier protein
VSTIIDRSALSAEESSNGQTGSRIVHFDATVRRKEKMRLQATAEPKTQQPETTAVAPPTAPTQPVAQAPAPAATPKNNGAFAHPAAAKPVAPVAAPNSNGSAQGNGSPQSNGSAAMPAGPELEKFLVEFVVEQTGYPEEMVELDADLEGDLGIDSIKKAQLFGELAERFEVNVAGADELSLDDFSTLRHVKSFLESAGSGAATETSPAPEPIPSVVTPAPVAAAPVQTEIAPTAIEPASAEVASTGTSVPHGADLEKFLIGFVVEQTGYPEEMVELDADLEADLGIDSIKKAQLFGELAEQFTIDMQSADDLSLDDFATLRDVMAFLEGASSTTVAASTPEPVAQARVQAPVAETTSPVAAAETSAGTSLNDVDLEKFLIDFVVEQTGYPEEMVELDADLEGDLGIDSIKKAQLFGELAEQFTIDMQSADDLSLDDFATLRHVKEFLQGNSQSATQPPAESDVVSSQPTPPPSPSSESPSVSESSTPPAGAAMSGVELEEFLVNFVVEQTGYPPEMVEMDADLESDLGIDSIKKAQLFGELAEQFEVNVQSDEELSLDDFPTLRDVMKFLEGAPQRVTA